MTRQAHAHTSSNSTNEPSHNELNANKCKIWTRHTGGHIGIYQIATYTRKNAATLHFHHVRNLNDGVLVGLREAALPARTLDVEGHDAQRGDLAPGFLVGVVCNHRVEGYIDLWARCDVM